MTVSYEELERRALAIELAHDILTETNSLPAHDPQCLHTYVDNGDLIVDLGLQNIRQFCGMETGKLIVTLVSSSELPGDESGIPTCNFAKPARVAIGVTRPRGPVVGQPDVLASFGIETEETGSVTITACLRQYLDLGEIVVSRDPAQVAMLGRLSANLLRQLLPSLIDAIDNTTARTPIKQTA